MKYSGWPKEGELVVGEIEDVNKDRGVYIDLDEYEDKNGFVHISEVASGWIKNIRDHVNEEKRVVAKVLDVDESSQQIDLSLKDVNDHQRKEKIQEWKNSQKADNWMELAFGEDISDEDYTEIANALLAEFGSLYEGFEQAAIHGTDALEDVELESEDIEAIVQTARQNVSVPFVTVTGYVDLECPAGDGVDTVREALQAAEGNGEIPEEVELDVTYVGAPEYRIEVQAPDYKTAESELEESADRAIAFIEDADGIGEFHRERRESDE